MMDALQGIAAVLWYPGAVLGIIVVAALYNAIVSQRDRRHGQLK